MAELPEIGLPIFKVLCAAPVAWQTPVEIAQALKQDPEVVLDLLSELDSSGWIAVWETEDGPLVTLSALAAERLEVRIVEVGFGQKPRWAPRGEPDRPTPPCRGVFLGERIALAQLLAATDLPPDQILERGERSERKPTGPKVPGRKEDSPRPTILVGLSLSPWPSPTAQHGEPCPACGGGQLRPHMYCIYCDRSGTDLPVTNTESQFSPRVARRLPSDDRIRATRAAEQARLRAQRKAKRAPARGQAGGNDGERTTRPRRRAEPALRARRPWLRGPSEGTPQTDYREGPLLNRAPAPFRIPSRAS